jgi:molecular chaperone DnaK (HSP70)
MIIGIDLGTTFSVIAVNGKVKLVDGYPEAHYMEKCDVSIIPDPAGNFIIPSAVWEDDDHPGQWIVGAAAKDVAAKGYSPVVFSKRDIGTDIMHPLGNKQYSAREIARIILKYLKEVAEQALGEPVTQAVVTHPAYFDPSMREETAMAARDAGFDFDPEKHLLMEPQAAALSYTRSDERDPLRILTYDLGGGTFDITYMERRGGIFNLKKFGGNRLLGGYNFDRELANWLLQRMRDRGVHVTVDESTPERRGKWARLMFVAEETKIKLSNARSDQQVVYIKEQNIFKDDLGNVITLQDQIDRKKYKEMIREMLVDTVIGPGGEGQTKGCIKVLEDAGKKVDELDEILLVGGSCYGPWVEETILAQLNKQPQQFEPDHCVAAGAAIYGTTLPMENEALVLNAPPATALMEVNVSGQVKSARQAALAADANAVLNDAMGVRLQVGVKPDGTFLFENVPLQPGSVNTFQLQIVDGQNHMLVEHSFEIAQSSEASFIEVHSSLPKPLYLEVVEGMKALAEEGQPLPAHCEVELGRANEDDIIQINLYQESTRIGTVDISGVPKEASGGKVKLIIDITPGNRITGQAVVFTRKGVEAARAVVDVRIPPIPVPSKEKLHEQLKELQGELDQQIAMENDAERRMELQAKGVKAAESARKLIDDPGQNNQESMGKVRELDHLLHPTVVKMNPPLEDFEALVVDIKELIAEHGDDPVMQSHSSALDRLESTGRSAYQKKNHKDWAQTFAGLVSLRQKLTPKDPGSGGGGRDIPTPILKMQVGQMIDQLRPMLKDAMSKVEEQAANGSLSSQRVAQKRATAEQLRNQIDQTEASLEQIPDGLDAKAAMSKVQLILHQYVGKINADIESLTKPDTRGGTGARS